MGGEIDPAQLVQEALAGGGRIRLGSLLAALVPAEELRAIARRAGLTPKGGYRLASAPVAVLAATLAESGVPDVLDRACAALAARLGPGDGARGGGAAPAASLQPVLDLKERELERQRAEVDKARRAAARERKREAERTRELMQEREAVARLRAEIRALRRQLEGRGLEPTEIDERQRRIHELLREVEVLEQAEEAHRRRAAEHAARIRELEAEVERLTALVPRGRRRVEPPPKPLPVTDEFRIPHFAPSFYKALEGKDRRSVQRAVQAVLLFCTEGPSHPGLEVKQLEGGRSLWSLRASLKLRVYFVLRDDGVVEVLDLADREDQHTTLRRWKDRRLDGGKSQDPAR